MKRNVRKERGATGGERECGKEVEYQKEEGGKEKGRRR